MKFAMPRKSFLDALKTVQPAVARRVTLPILSGVRLEAAAGRVRIEATDLETAIATSVATDVVVAAPGTAVAPAMALIKAVGTMTDAQIEISREEQEARSGLEIRCGSRSVALHGLAAEDWPRTRISDLPSEPVAIADATSFGDALGRVVLCASDDEARPVLTGVALFIDRKAKAMDLVATDSYRLGAARVPLARCGKVHEGPPTIPARAARAFAKHLRKMRGQVRIHVEQDNQSPTRVAMRLGDETWCMRMIDGQFPEWHQLLGVAGGATLEFDAVEMSSALKAMAAIRSNGTPVRLILGDQCTIALSERDRGEFSEPLDSATYTADGVGPIEVGFNADYLADAIRFIGAERTTMRVRSALKPAIFEHARRRCALMPVRLS